MDNLKTVFVWLTGIIFLCIFFPLTFIIWLLVLPFDRNRTITHWLVIYQGLLLSEILPVWKIVIEGREKAKKGTTYVIISNHQSILDIILINCLRYRFKWISKIENMKAPFIGWYLRMADYITIDRGNLESKVEMMRKSNECLDKGISIMIFPEGTRSPEGRLGTFKRGAFQLAIGARKPILPVIIDGTGDILPKHGLKFTSTKKINIRVYDPVEPQMFGTDNPDILAARFHNFMAAGLERLRAGQS